MSLKDYEFNTETHAISCTECGDPPSLVALDKNDGIVIECGCDGATHSLDSMPYEYAVHHLPDSWEVTGEETE